ncbi:MAG TPA: type II secretion system protein GspL [Hydrogenophaga sp.]
MLILTPSSFSVTSTPAPATAVDWARTSDGLQVIDHGTSALSALPTDAELVLVMPPQSVSWHQITLPKVPAARLRAVLDGLLEERLLSDTSELHFALAPGAKASAVVWVAACHKAWLKRWVQALEDVGRPVTRIVPGLSPLAPTETDEVEAPGVTLHWAHQQSDQPWLASASAEGVSCSPLVPQVGSALDITAPTPGAQVQWLAEPAVAAQAEQCFDLRFTLLTLPNWLLRCAQSDWNLAQFDLSLSNAARRGQRMRQLWRELRTAPGWRPARWGLVAMLAIQVIGLNAAAWQERRALKEKQQALGQILQTTFPNIQLVLDAPVQMQRELANMRQSNGQLSTADLEAMLSAIALAAAEEPVAMNSIQYQRQGNSGEGHFAAGGSGATLWPQLLPALQRAGWEATIQDNRITLRPAQP